MAIKSSGQNKLRNQTDLGINPSSVTSYEDSGKFINFYESESESGSVVSYSFQSMDCILFNLSMDWILQARILEWVAFPFSKESSQPRDGTQSESEVAQSCPTLCDPVDCSLPGSSVHGILQARILEWVAISFSRGSSWPRDQTQVSCIGGRCFNLWATREALISGINVKDSFLAMSPADLHKIQTTVWALSSLWGNLLRKATQG